MKMILIFIGILCTILITQNVVAESQYGKMDVYYNDNPILGKETPKPILKIGEPFSVGINLTVYQKSEVSIELNEIGEGYFTILDGPTSKMNVYRADVIEKNSSKLYRWTVTPTEKWAGGALPLDLVYQIDDFKTKKSLVHSSFTIAYPYISNEHYKDEAPTPKDKEVLEPEPTTTPNPASTQGFSLVALLQRLHFWFQNFSPVEEYYKNLEPLES